MKILTPDGIRDLKRKGIDVITIYLYSNLSTISRRLTFRGDKEAEIDRRVKADLQDFHDTEMLADRIVYNNLSDEIDDVVESVDYWYKRILKERQNEK